MCKLSLLVEENLGFKHELGVVGDFVLLSEVDLVRFLSV